MRVVLVTSVTDRKGELRRISRSRTSFSAFQIGGGHRVFGGEEDNCAKWVITDVSR